MKYLEYQNTTIPSNHIVNVTSLNNSVVITDTNGIDYILFSGNQKACDEYKTSLLTLLDLTEKITLPDIHWIDYIGTKELAVGMAYKPTIKYDGKETQDFTLKSSQVGNAKIQDKLIMGLKVGESQITATSQSKNETITLNVMDKKLDLNFEKDVKICVNRNIPLKLFDKYGNTINPYYVNFTSLNTDKFKIDNNGVTTGVSVGSGIIIAKYNNDYYFKNVNVLPEPPELQKENITLKVDETNQQSISDSHFSNPEWLSDNINIAIVNKDSGLITAKKVGKCKIIGKFKTPYETIVKEVSVTVQPKAPTPNKENKTLKVDEKFTGVMPQKAGFSGAKWVSDNGTFAIVDQNSGLVTAKKHGTTNIRGKFTKPYETDGIIYNLTIQPKAPQVVTETSEIQVEGTANATLPSVDGFSGQFWESTDPQKATVDEGTGLVTGVAEGQCEIKGYFTTPYKVLAKKISLTIQPKTETQSYNTFMWR